MNLPNKLTLSRMIIAPIYLAVMLMDFNWHFLIGGIIFGIASLTDFFDGMLARKYNQVTVFGKLCDPVGDKMLVVAAMLAFLKFNLCSPWVIMIIISREFIVTSLRLVASSQGVIIPAGILGKIKTACQMIFICAIMVFAQFPAILGSLNLEAVSGILMWITAALAIVSGIQYFLDARKLIDITK